MASKASVKIDSKELKRAEEMWAGFMSISKYSIGVIIVILAGLALAFVR